MKDERFSIRCSYCDKRHTVEKSGMQTVKCEHCGELFTDRAVASVGELSKTDSNDLRGLRENVAELTNLVKSRLENQLVTPDTVAAALHKAIETPLIGDQVDERQRTSKPFVPKFANRVQKVFTIHDGNAVQTVTRTGRDGSPTDASTRPCLR